MFCTLQHVQSWADRQDKNNLPENILLGSGPVGMIVREWKVRFYIVSRHSFSTALEEVLGKILLPEGKEVDALVGIWDTYPFCGDKAWLDNNVAAQFEPYLEEAIKIFEKKGLHVFRHNT